MSSQGTLEQLVNCITEGFLPLEAIAYMQNDEKSCFSKSYCNQCIQT